MNEAPDNPSAIWIPHRRQQLVLQCPAHEILYGGAAGAGKSMLLIFDWIKHYQSHGKNAKGLMIRRTYPELEDLIAELKRVFSGMQGAPKWMEAKRWFQYPDGAVLEMGYLESYDDALRYQGRAFTWLGFDEITHLRDPKAYEFLLTRMRSAHRVQVRVVCTTNPGGPGHSWVMKRWKIDTNPSGMVPNVIETKFKDTDGCERVKRWMRIFIPGRLEDNPTLDADGSYRANLMMKDERTRKMLLEGRWDVVDGAFFGEWDPSVHVVRSFKPPAHWKRWMGADWGTYSPCAFLWFCQSPNGEIYVYREIYGIKLDEDGDFIPNKGWGKTAREVAQLIRAREREAGEIITERYLDAHDFKKAGHETSIADEFQREGVFFQPSKKGTRDASEGPVNHLREFLKVTNGQTRLKFMDCCVHTIRTFPQIQTDPANPNVYDSKGEDHAIDACIYGLRRNTADNDDVNRASRAKRANSQRLQQFASSGCH